MAYKLIKKSTIGGNVFEQPKNYGQRVQLARVDEHNLYSGLTITSLDVTAIDFAMKAKDKINIGGQLLTLDADAAATATSLSVDSTVLDFDINFNANIEFDQNNLFVQYQRKTEGTIAGMPVSVDTLGPIGYNGGNYIGEFDVLNGVDLGYMKILPRDFMINDDNGNEALNFKDSTVNSGVQVGAPAQEMIATVNIPAGTTATEVKIWGSNTGKVVEVYELAVNTTGIGSVIGTGYDDGVAIDIADTQSTAYNYLLILVKVSAVSQRIYGGYVTLV